MSAAEAFAGDVGERNDHHVPVDRSELDFRRIVVSNRRLAEVDGMDADLFVMPDGSTFAVTPGVAPSGDDRTVGFLVDDLDDARRALLASGVELSRRARGQLAARSRRCSAFARYMF